MAFVIKDPPEFTVEIQQWTRETLADGAEMAKVPESLLNNDIYLKNQAERQAHVTEITLTAAGWIGSTAPYVQTVSVLGATADLEPILVGALEDGADAAVQKAYSKAFGIISSGTAVLGDGEATFKVYKKPASDCRVGLKGV